MSTAGHDLVEVACDDPHVLGLLDAYFAELRVRLPSYIPPSIESLRTDGEQGVTILLLARGLPVGCGSLRVLASDTAEVKRMFVRPEARGRGHAKQILTALEERARRLQCSRVLLDTAAPLHEATALYLREGYVPVERYNDNPVAAKWFEKRLKT